MPISRGHKYRLAEVMSWSARRCWPAVTELRALITCSQIAVVDQEAQPGLAVRLRVKPFSDRAVPHLCRRLQMGPTSGMLCRLPQVRPLRPLHNLCLPCEPLLLLLGNCEMMLGQSFADLWCNVPLLRSKVSRLSWNSWSGSLKHVHRAFTRRHCTLSH